VNVRADVSRGVRSAPSIEQQLIAAVERAELRHDPFDHIVLEQVVDRATYRTFLAALPGRESFHYLKHHDAVQKDGSSTRLRMYLYPELLRRLPKEQQSVWMPLARALCSPGLEQAFKRKFRATLEQRFGKPVEKVRVAPIPILLRDQPGYRIGIHSDVARKAITAQFYLPRDESQRDLGTIFHEGKDGEAAARITRMQFLPASGYAFPVALTKSWHSAATATDSDGERVSMMVTYYVAESPFRRVKLALGRAALRLGIHPRG